MERFKFSLQYPKPLKESELTELIEVAKSGLFSRYTSELTNGLEKQLAAYYETNHAITCTSGTAALHGCLVALALEPGSEVIMTSIADIGIVLPVIYENLVPVFADVDPETYNISVDEVRKCLTPKTKAIIAVHLAGNPCDLTGLRALCDEQGIVLLEDFSQAHGAMWQGKKIGSIGDISYGSFQQSKQITCGEGGVIVTNDDRLARRAFIGVDKAWQRNKPLNERFYEFLAPNVRFNALQAAVLIPQLKRLDHLIQMKRDRADILYAKLRPYNDILKSQKILLGAKHSYYSFPLYVESQLLRDQIVETLDKEFNVESAYGYANPKPLYQCVGALMEPEKYGRGFKYSSRQYPAGTCPIAEDLLTRSFLLPFNENFTLDQTAEIGDRLVKVLEKVFNSQIA